MTLELDAKAERAIEKVRKLLALATNNPNEEEATAASAKAMEILEAHNLDMATVEQGSKPKHNRGRETLKGGLYQWQRELWDAVARLNFCYYRFVRGLQRGQSYQHILIGRKDNVVSTEVMAEYLQHTVERLAREYGKQVYPGQSCFIRELIAYREGISDRLIRRLWELRQKRLDDEKRKQREEEVRNRHPAAATGTSIVLADVMQTEDDLNNDFVNGWEPGTTAQNRADWKARQAALKAEEEERLRLRDEAEERDPALREARLRQEAFEARKRAKQREKDAERWRNRTYREREPTAREKRAMMGDHYRGYQKGGDIGLDKQIDKDERKALS